MDEPIDFVYTDTDSFANEISELYSYGEESEFFANRNAFEESMEDSGLPLNWKHMVPEQQSRAINYLMSTLEVSCRSTRLKSCRALAYLIQGNFGECLTIEEQILNSQRNVFLLYEQGLFQAFVQQLLIESDLTLNSSNQASQSSMSSSQIFNDSSELRLILSVLYTITETMYHAKDSTDPKEQELRQQYIFELQTPIGDELLSVTLFQMLNVFCGGLAPHYPVRKITLLLWKVILITLGGTQSLRELKETNRNLNNLKTFAEDTIEVARNMRPCSPPLLPDGQAKTRTALTGGFVANKRKVFKQPAFDDAVYAYAKECLLNSLAELNQPDIDNENSDENGEFLNELNDSNDNLQNSDDTAVDNVERKQYDAAFTDIMSDYIEKFEETREVGSKEENIVVDDDDNEKSSPYKETKFISETPINTSGSDSGITDTSDNEGSSSTSESEKTSDAENPITVIEDKKRLEELVKQCFGEPEDELQPNDNIDNDIAITTTSSSLKPNIVISESQQIDASRSDVTTIYKGLPWAPKVRKADLSQHISNLRQKFLGYTLPNDLETTFGFPEPIIEGINVLKKHLYISLSEIQLEREEAMEKYPLTHKELHQNYVDAPTEKLYIALLPRLPQYMIALLKILLAASTNTKNKTERTESINIMCEMNCDSASPSIIQTMKMSADSNRHKEIIIKAVSAILILLLKHFKINHIYQFEYVSQQLMFANCIPLILKFLSQDIYSYIVTSKSNISAIDFPACVIGEQPELTTEAIELCSFQQYSWRNMYSCINLVRILNKLTKWKHSRIMMLVVFKSAPTLAKALSVRQSMFQLYVLKLLKVQLKFLGRQWKKTNMKLISAIYQKVRHRLTDDWAYSNDNEARPWDFQAEEFTLQANINKFHQRRYHNLLNPNNNRACNSLIFSQTNKFGAFDDYTDEDYDFGLDEISQISPQFERNYEKWLENEVFQRNIDWSKLLEN